MRALLLLILAATGAWAEPSKKAKKKPANPIGMVKWEQISGGFAPLPSPTIKTVEQSCADDKDREACYLAGLRAQNENKDPAIWRTYFSDACGRGHGMACYRRAVSAEERDENAAYWHELACKQKVAASCEWLARQRK